MADSDDDDNDNTFVTIGTPLEVYENDEVVSRKPVSIEDQVVKDAQGRQRFHGAFTGGFSAGYFNTVGSKEGWAPKTFVSSRSQRHEASVGQKPEDFMDEEDLGEFGIAPRIIATKQNFLSNERERKRKAVAVAALSGKSAIPGVESLLVDLILPKKSSIGIRLLRKLGWKEGQGIGPRSRKMPAEPEEDQPQTVSEGQKVYGCMLPPGFSAKEKNLSSEDSDEDYNSVSFAPKDVCPVNFEPKDNLHGIGYRGLDPRLALGNFSFQEPAAVTTKVGRRGIRGQAFGVGAFENDDDDIYSSESMANYDVEITEEKPDSANFGWTGSHQRRGDKFTRHETDVLPGFVKAVVAVQPRRNYPPPQLPRDFKPFHKFESQEGSQKTPNSTAGQKTLDASTRGVLLGEAPHLNSVFELVSNEDRSKMEAAKMQGEILKKQQQTEQSSLDSTKSVRADHQLGSTASTPTATKLSAFGFKPFAKFPEKQKRYEEYLEAVKHGKTYEPTCGSNTTEWEQEHEREEFAQAARLYRPLAGMIASRFTRAEHGDDDNVTLPPKQDVEKSDKEKAASMKMFGKLTRDRFEWHPDKVLCKRFNIANPYPDSTVVGVPSVKRDKYSVFNFLNFPSQDEVQPPPVHVREEPKAAEVVSAKLKPLAILATVDLRPRVEHVTVSADSEVSNTASPSGAAEGVVTQSSDHTTATTMSEADGRPPMDLFKAIFENSDSDDSDEVASDKEDGAKEPQPAPNATVALPLASAQVTPPSDIPRDAPSTAAAISHTKQDSDIGFLAASFINETAEKAKCEESSQSEDNKLPSPPTTTPSAAAFGPSLPPPVSTESSSKALDSHGRHRRHHRRKESHKHKKAKHKKKEKKQKDKKRKKRKEVIEVDSSSSDDADKEDEDTDDDDDDDIAGLDRTLLDRLKTMAARR